MKVKIGSIKEYNSGKSIEMCFCSPEMDYNEGMAAQRKVSAGFFDQVNGKFKKVKHLVNVNDIIDLPLPEDFLSEVYYGCSYAPGKSWASVANWFVENKLIAIEEYTDEEIKQEKNKKKEKEKKEENKRKKDMLKERIKNTIIVSLIVIAIVGVIAGLMIVGYRDEKKDDAAKERVEQMSKDRSNYVLKDLAWFEREAKGQMGYDNDNPVFVKIAMIVDYYKAGTFYVIDDKCKNWTELHFSDSSYRDQVEEYYYDNQAFYAYCQVKAGMLYLVMADLQ